MYEVALALIMCADISTPENVEYIPENKYCSTTYSILAAAESHMQANQIRQKCLYLTDNLKSLETTVKAECFVTRKKDAEDEGESFVKKSIYNFLILLN